MSNTPVTSDTNFNKYIYFDYDSINNHGRVVYINPFLIKSILDNVFSKNNGGQLARKMLSDLGQLKNQAGNINSVTSQNKPGMHRSTFGSVQVTYTIVQDSNAKNRGPGVYISNITSLDIGPGGKREEFRPGFHLVEKHDERMWRINKGQGQIGEISTLVGAIGAEVDSEHYYSARDTAQSFGQTIHDLGANSQDMFSLYYSPSYIIDSLGTWLTPDQKKMDSGQHKIALARILKKSVENDTWSSSHIEQHQWFVFANGAKLLSQALDEYQKIAGGKPLSNHQFRLLDPLEKVAPLLTKLKTLGATIDTSKIGTAGSRVYQLMNFEEYKNIRSFASPQSLKSFSSAAENVKKYLSETNENSCFREILIAICNETNNIHGEWS